MEKINPIYSLRIEIGDGNPALPLNAQFQPQEFVEITLPYTLEFSVSRQSLSSSQKGTFRVQNLGQVTRNSIQKDYFQTAVLRAVQFRAGYAGEQDSDEPVSMPLVFNGVVLSAYSWKESGGDWVTEIEAFDGGFPMANGNSVNISQVPGITGTQTMKLLAGALPTVGSPIIGDFPTTNLRQEPLLGNAWDYIKQKSGGLACYDNGQLKVLNYNDAVNGPLQQIDASVGILGSPKRSAAMLEFELLFEPRLTLCQWVTVVSETNPEYNLTWKVMGFEHRGTISSSVGGERRTTVKLWFSTMKLNVLQGANVIQ